MEVLDINTLLERRSRLLEWIADIDMSVPDLAMDVKFWRAELLEIDEALAKLPGQEILFRWADKMTRGRFEKDSRFTGGLGIRFGEFGTSLVNIKIIKEWRYYEETNS